MLYRPVAGFASYTGLVPGPCWSQDSATPVLGVWKHDHGRGQRSPSVRHLAVLEESAASLRAGRSVTEVSWVSDHGGSVESRTIAMAAQSSMMLPASWDTRRSSPFLLETEGLGGDQVIQCLEAEGRFADAECPALDEPEVSGLSEPGGAEKGPKEKNAGQVERGDAEAASVLAHGAINGSLIGAATGESTSPNRVHPNKGKMPWNKGKRHSPETIARIRQRTIEAMCNPVIREKLRNCAVNQRCSDETKAKIRAAIAANWNTKRLARKSQEACLNEWKELVAEAARNGGYGDDELQWDSYRTILRQLIFEEKERVKAMRREMQRKDSKQNKKRIAPAGSPEHRQKISEAIRAKWSDPDYRRKVSEGLQKFAQEKTGVIKGPPRKRVPTIARVPKVPSITGSKLMGSVTKPTQRPAVSQGCRPSAMEEPLRQITFVDPRANEKLERMRRIQAGRQMMELKKLEASERARLLMAEAEKAANALEAVAVTDEAARLYLVETRRLLAEAADKIRTAESRR